MSAVSVEDAARAFERAGDAAGAVAVFEAALAASPQDGSLLAGLARLAERIRSPELALSCWSLVHHAEPARHEAIEGLARALGQLGRHGEATELIRTAINVSPEISGLWTTLGRLANEQADVEGALVYFGEAARLDPLSAAPRYNRGILNLELGELDAAAEDFAAALSLAVSPAQRAETQLADAFVKLGRGQLGEGWRAYEVRLSPDRPDAPVFQAPGTRWTSGGSLAGQHLLVVGEQGVGDQIMFAHLLQDLPGALGPEGRLSVAVDPRLVSLMRRSFPRADVLPLQTEITAGRTRHRVANPPEATPTAWAPIASLAQRLRCSLADFPAASAYLAPSPEAVAHWRRWLAAGPPAVGLSWRSRAAATERRRQAPGLQAVAPILRTAGLRFVNLQYGVTAEELAEASALAAGAFVEPPGLDLFNDFEGLAALCVALDVVVSTPNATGLLAAACGADVRLLDPAATWRRLGTDGYPWHPRARSYPQSSDGTWDRAVAEIAMELGGLA